MTTIWKYDLDVTDIQKVSMPMGAMPLHVAIQNPNSGVERTIQLWAAVDPARPKEDRLFAVVGTGNPAPEPDDAEYVGSVIDGPFVWHVFAESEEGWMAGHFGRATDA